MTPLGLLAAGAAIFLILLLRRDRAPLVLLAVASLIPLGEPILLGPFHFSLLRMVILAGIIRVLLRGEFSSLTLNRLDKALFLFLITCSLVYILHRGFSLESTVNRMGFAFNAMGAFLIFRACLRTREEVLGAFRLLALASLILATGMLMERATRFNPFSLLGNVGGDPVLRGETLRCQGPFLHPILAGTFGAMHFPFFHHLFSLRGSRGWGFLGMASAVAIVALAYSSGPLLALLTAGAVICLWPLRRSLRLLRWMGIGLLCLLALTMKAPIWFLMGKVSEITGGGGWHRSELINSFIIHFDEWWLTGTSATAHWMPTGVPYDPNQADITNQYIRVAVDGGLVSLLLFFLLITLLYRCLGRGMRVDGERSHALLLWTLGTALTVNLVSFLSVSYFDQTQVHWYLLLGAVSAVSHGASFFPSTSPNGGSPPGDRVGGEGVHAMGVRP